MATSTSPLPILLVGTAGLEVEPFATRDAWAMIHSAQPWSPRACSCGEMHAPCAPAVLTVLLGRPDSSVHFDPGACVLAVSPENSSWNRSEFSEVSCPTGDFNPWALEVVRHVISGVTGYGLLCFDLADLAATLRPARRLYFSRGTSPDDLVAAANDVVASASWLSSSVRSATIGVWTGSRTTLGEISAAATMIGERLANAQVYLFTPLTDGAAVVSVLGA